MIRASLGAAAALVAGLLSGPVALAQDPAPLRDLVPADAGLQRYSAEQLDNLVSPVALYPDALLAQVLIASTFPDQVEEAAAWVRANGTDGIDDTGWDVSVKAIAHYPSALNTLAESIDWTAALGRAYAYQSTDVMNAVQRMRALADEHGNLVSTEQQQVLREADQYVIVPTNPQIIYVPVYDPYVVYSRPFWGSAYSSRYWSFGVGFPIGSWLIYDLDWHARSVYYNGWNRSYFGWGGGWRSRSYPFIHVTNVYVHPRYRNVYVNRRVYERPVNYAAVERQSRVHRSVTYAEQSAAERNARNARAARSRDVTRAVEQVSGQSGGAGPAQRQGRVTGATTDLTRQVEERSARRIAESVARRSEPAVERNAQDRPQVVYRDRGERVREVVAQPQSGRTPTVQRPTARQVERPTTRANLPEVIRRVPSTSRPVPVPVQRQASPTVLTPPTRATQRTPSAAERQSTSARERVMRDAQRSVQQPRQAVQQPSQRTQVPQRPQVIQRPQQRTQVQQRPQAQQPRSQPRARTTPAPVVRSHPPQTRQQPPARPPQRAAPARPAPQSQPARQPGGVGRAVPTRPIISSPIRPAGVQRGSSSGGLRGAPIGRP